MEEAEAQILSGVPSGEPGSITQAAKRRGRKRPFVGEGMKVCARCKQILSVEMFGIDQSRSDGYTPRCRACSSEANKRYVKCERCGGLRSYHSVGKCRACYRSKGAFVPEPAIKWKVSWRNRVQTATTVARPKRISGAHCKACGKWFTWKGGKKRDACGTKCGLVLGRQLAIAQSPLPYDFDLLYGLYWNKGLSTNQIGKMYGLKKGSAPVWLRLKALGIPTRRKGTRATATTCIIDECGAPVHRIKHATNGSWYGVRCLEHWVAHRQKLTSEYWLQILKWRKLGLGENATAETLSELIERIVPRTLLYDVREELCQDVALKVIMRSVEPSEIELFVKRYVKERVAAQYSHLSIDAPISDDDTRTLGQKLGL